MSSEPLSDQPSTPLAAPAAAPVGATAAGPATSPTPSRTSTGRGSAVTLLLGAVAAAALVSSGLLWQKLSAIQEQLARQSADAGAQAIEARTMARQAEELVRETAARHRPQLVVEQSDHAIECGGVACGHFLEPAGNVVFCGHGSDERIVVGGCRHREHTTTTNTRPATPSILARRVENAYTTGPEL